MADAPLATISLDISKTLGRIKPMHAVGQPPTLGWNDYSMFHFLKEAHIPYSRLHDTGGAFGKNLYVDIPNLFRDFDADENDPASYDFAFTDLLLAALVKNGVEPFFRLGVTIENKTEIRKYRIFPPKDFAKWARICEHVVAHYNEGWANGFHFGITYWEIWNEADDRANPEESFMWCGTFSEYCRLYEITAKHLKAKFPSIKVGGPASCGFSAAEPGKPIQVAHDLSGEDWRCKYGPHFIKCAHQFLDHVRDTASPMDFFSFHTYTDVETLFQQVECIALEMERRGLKGVELILDEWLPKPGLNRIFKAPQNSEVAAVIVRGQHSALDMLMLYDARCAARNPYAPLFDPMTARPAGAYWALFYFGELYRRGQEVFSSVGGKAGALCAAAATDGKDCALMLVNPGDEPRALSFETNGAVFRFGAVTDEDRTNDLMTDCPASIGPHAFMLLVFDRQR